MNNEEQYRKVMREWMKFCEQGDCEYDDRGGICCKCCDLKDKCEYACWRCNDNDECIYEVDGDLENN